MSVCVLHKYAYASECAGSEHEYENDILCDDDFVDVVAAECCFGLILELDLPYIAEQKILFTIQRYLLCVFSNK